MFYALFTIAAITVLFASPSVIHLIVQAIDTIIGSKQKK